MAITTSAALISDYPGFVVETTEGTTPSTPTFTAFGAVKSIGIKINGNFVDIAQIGSEDLIAIQQGQQEYETTWTMTVNNITGILDRLIDSANFATPTGTVSETVSIEWSFYLNGTTKNYIICKGSRVKEGSVTMEVGKETEVTVTFVHTNITTSASSGTAGATYASKPTGEVYDWIAGGADPVSWNSTGLDCKKFTINISRNTKASHTLGNLNPHSSQSHGRRISGDFSVLYTVNTLETDFKAGTARTLAAVIKTSVGTITVTGAKIVDYSRDTGVDADDVVLENCTFRGLSVAIAA